MTRDTSESKAIVDPFARSLAELERHLQCIRAVGYLLTRFKSVGKGAEETDFVPAGCGAIISSEANAMMKEIEHLRGMSAPS